ncbi:DUF4440 domain-containing protein [Archangium violaceum]|uniref:Uncharacterized protein n=1 Tax=Archangium violaceum Cb vi76 TaxID=1406225 RepID=A0A084STB3_9BACT|nr:DUF4440 domain-containing protein [Archangium violaceum]KFA91698.1 hypothetical protein Q664_20385 [Archangium violaceum Cb vi76]
MKRTILVCITAVAISGSAAWAQDKAKKPAEQKPAAASEQAPGMDMKAMGPGARKPTNEKQTKKEVQEFFKQQEELEKKGDFEASLATYDFPIYMVTDDLKGVPESGEYTREAYAAMMKPMFEGMPKDLKVTHKPTITVLSDSLVSVVDDFTMTQGKQKVTGRNTSLLVKRDGQWKWKTMVEAGWGGMPPEGASGGAQTPPEGKK